MSGSGQVAIEAVQAPDEVYTERVDLMAHQGGFKVWISLRHHDSKNKYVLRLQSSDGTATTSELLFIVERAGRNTTLASARYPFDMTHAAGLEIVAHGFTFSVYALSPTGAPPQLLFTTTDTVGLIPAGAGDSMDLYVNAHTQACWDELSGAPVSS